METKEMRSLRCNILVVSLLLLSSATAGAQQTSTETTESPAVRRGRDLIQLINSGDRVAAAAYIKENYAPEFMRIPLSQHLDFVSQVHDTTRGVEFQGVQSSGTNDATLSLKSKLTGNWHELVVRVEPNAPHRIAGIGMRGAAPPAGARPKQKLSEAQMAKELEAHMKKLAEADVFSGTVLLAKDGQVIFKGAYGTANKDFNAPNRIDTKFNLGSMNKMFTAVAIAQLVERGKLSLDDPLAKFMPDFPSKDAAEKIKIKHLLSHTAGLGSYFNRKFQESSRELYRTVDEMLKLAQDEKMAFEPGTRWQYSNTGMLVLGKVIEKASGQDFFEYIRENIYKPAGMINSDCYELDHVNQNLAVGYEKEYGDKGYTFENNIFKHVMRGGPAGGGYSTVEDLHRFAVALRAGKLVGAEYVKLLLSAKPELNSPNYGYGFQISAAPRIAGHGGGFPGISSNLDMFLDNGYIAVVMSNYGGASRLASDKLRELVMAGQETKASDR
jgi:CubicO group peptidase (beta-lactamase class C family)